MTSVGGWTIAHIAAVKDNGLLGNQRVTTEVTLEHSDARLNGVTFTAIEALSFALPGWVYALRLKRGSLQSAIVLQRNTR